MTFEFQIINESGLRLRDPVEVELGTPIPRVGDTVQLSDDGFCLVDRVEFSYGESTLLGVTVRCKKEQ